MRTTKIAAVGDKVKLRSSTSGGVGESGESGDPRLAEGQVVRVEEVDPGDAGPWLRKVAVQFTGGFTVTAEDIATFKERAMRLWIK